MGDTSFTPGPLAVVEDAAWPWSIHIQDASGNNVLTERRAAWAGKWRTLDDLRELRGIHGAEREVWKHALDRQLADMHLRAAAPDLYEALAELLKIRSGRTVSAAKTALAKARGEIA